ncbi:MAG: hypothetical protein O7J95_09200 [Planctomycetota bacterium]|nr:hypothetical protein [Planctomycetota bacterium]
MIVSAIFAMVFPTCASAPIPMAAEKFVTHARRKNPRDETPP